MGLFDTLLGRTKPVKANLDALFALPSAAVTLQVTSGLVSTRKAGVCFKPPAGQNFTDMQTELEKMLELGDDAGTTARRRRPGHRGPRPTGRRDGIRTLAGQHPDRASRGRPLRLPLDPARGRRSRRPRHPGPHGPLVARGRRLERPAAVFGLRLRPRPVGAPTAPGPDAVTQPIFLVYLAKQGTFYPFAPTGSEQRDTELEIADHGPSSAPIFPSSPT